MKREGCERTFQEQVSSVAQRVELERALEFEIMLERQREGIAKAKGQKLYKGRKPTALRHTIIELHRQGMGVAGILKQIRSMEDEKGNRYEIGQTSAYQIIADYRKEAEVAAA